MKEARRERRYRNSHIKGRAFHVVIALILVICALSPYLELAAGGNDSVFATGYDTETTFAVLVLLLELVISLGGLLAYLCGDLQPGERIAITYPSIASESGSCAEIADLWPPPPLRI